MKKTIMIFFAVLFSLGAHAQQAVDGTIQGGVVRPLALAIPDFSDEAGNSTEIGGKIKNIVASDLRSTGLFRDLPSESYLTGNGTFDAPVDFANWSGIGAEGYIKGSVVQNGDNLTVKFRLFDVVAQKEVGEGMVFEGSNAQWRRFGHKVADAIYTRFTGEGPYFDSRIAFVAETGPKGARKKAIAVMDSDGANMKYITDGSALVLAPRWAGNTRDVIFTSYESGEPKVVLVNTQTNERRVLSDLPGLAFAPRYSPDGRTLLVSLIDETGNTDLYQIDVATGSRARLTTEPSIETAASFSPDGSQIVFESDRSGSQALYIMPVGGGEARKISQGGGKYATPVWSPKGDLIAYTKIEGGQFHIGVMNVDGSGERLITSSFIDEGPTWAPNGRALMFFRETAGAGGAPQLRSISLTGRNMVEIGTPDFASDPNWSKLMP